MLQTRIKIREPTHPHRKMILHILQLLQGIRRHFTLFKILLDLLPHSPSRRPWQSCESVESGLRKELLEHEVLPRLDVEQVACFGVGGEVNGMLPNSYCAARFGVCGGGDDAVGEVVEGEGELV